MGWTVCIWKAVNSMSTVSARKGFGCMFFNTSISDEPLESIWEKKRGAKFGCCSGSPPSCFLNLTKFMGRLDIDECHCDCCSELPAEYLNGHFSHKIWNVAWFGEEKPSLVVQRHSCTHCPWGHSTELSLLYGEGSQMNHLYFPMKNLIIFLGSLPGKLCLSTCDPRKL